MDTSKTQRTAKTGRKTDKPVTHHCERCGAGFTSKSGWCTHNSKSKCGMHAKTVPIADDTILADMMSRLIVHDHMADIRFIMEAGHQLLEEYLNDIE